jgi:hypothetical protein
LHFAAKKTLAHDDRAPRRNDAGVDDGCATGVDDGCAASDDDDGARLFSAGYDGAHPD